MAARLRGRPPVVSDRAERNDVFRFLQQVTGPAVGLPALRWLFPALLRVVLACLLLRFRRVWRWRHMERGYRLTWHRPGAVWAIDHSEPRHPVDGLYPYLLAVRDLASGYQLAWTGVRTVGADETEAIVAQLMAEHGAPLTLKSDNGSAFASELFRRAMLRAEAVQLFSPPRRPAYNGALERSNGVNKIYTHQHAIHQGHPLRWTSADLEHARTLANTISRPWGMKGPTPAEAWHARQPITRQERDTFQTQLAQHRSEVAEEMGIDLAALPLPHADQARLDRVALQRVLEGLGYLTLTLVRRRRANPSARRATSWPALARHHELATHDSRDSTPITDPPVRRQKSLATTTPADKIRDGGARDARPQQPLAAPHTRQPTHRERARPSWFQRLITPLVRVAKTAKIM